MLIQFQIILILMFEKYSFNQIVQDLSMKTIWFMLIIFYKITILWELQLNQWLANMDGIMINCN